MKLPVTILLTTLLATGCANFPAGTDTTTGDKPASTESSPSPAATESPASTASTAPRDKNDVRERKVQFGNWRVDCIYEAVTLITQCKAETYGTITEYYGDEIYHPTPVLWVSWLKGEPRLSRSVCVFGHDYPVVGVSMQIDDNTPFLIEAINAAGCIIANKSVLDQLRNGHELVVTFQRWPWGQTKAAFSLNKSINALNELERLIAEQ